MNRLAKIALVLPVLLGLAPLCHPGVAVAADRLASSATLPLSGGDWRIHEDADGKGAEHRMFEADVSVPGWLPATVPGNIQADLEAAHQLKPLWYGAGDPRMAEVAQKNWWYRKDFVAPKTYEGWRVKLVFDGVDHECEVWLNGKVFEQSLPEGLGLQKADPAHLAFPATATMDVPPGVLREGKNTIEVQVENSGWFTWDSLCLTSND
jgi:hypothetical protein